MNYNDTVSFLTQYVYTYLWSPNELNTNAQYFSQHIYNTDITPDKQPTYNTFTLEKSPFYIV